MFVNLKKCSRHQKNVYEFVKNVPNIEFLIRTVIEIDEHFLKRMEFLEF